MSLWFHPQKKGRHLCHILMVLFAAYKCLLHWRIEIHFFWVVEKIGGNWVLFLILTQSKMANVVPFSTSIQAYPLGRLQAWQTTKRPPFHHFNLILCKTWINCILWYSKNVFFSSTTATHILLMFIFFLIFGIFKAHDSADFH